MEGKTNMFGKAYNTIGSTDSNFIIKTKGDLKVLWGNKFIDLIKKGKVAAPDVNYFRTVSSIDEIKSNGIYKVGSDVYVMIDGTLIKISEDTNTYVSFLNELLVTADLKNTALTNIGFYYESITDAKNAQAGLIFVLETNKLYLVSNGTLTEYMPTLEESEVVNVFDSITVSDLKIYKDGTDMFIDTPTLIMRINDLEVLAFTNGFEFKTNISIIDGNYIQSLGANSSKGFRLYNVDGKSVLEIDTIIERDRTEQYTNDRLIAIYGEHNNIITNITTLDDNLECTLGEDNKFEVDDYIYVLVLLLVLTEYSNGTLEITLSEPLLEDFIITVGGTEYTIKKGQETLTVSGVLEDVSIEYPILKIPHEYKVIKSEELIITVEVPEKEQEEFKKAYYIHTSRKPLIYRTDNNLNLMDRSKTIIDPETKESVIDNRYHSIIGTVIELDIELLKEKEENEEEERPEVGIYSDNLIALNPILYNTLFKTVGKDKDTEHPKYPKYFEEIELPEEKKKLDKMFNYVVPDMEWIKLMLDLYFPVGTIIMFNGQSEIPPGWCICDGSNGTPNLIGRFIKAGTSLQINNPEGVDEENRIQIKESNLPKHSHPHLPHSHSGSTDSASGATSGSGGDKSGGASPSSHSHSVYIDSATSEEAPKNWPNEKIKIEPRSYSLIFIMKVESFVDYIFK